MLRLRKEAATAVEVEVAPGAFVRVRPASVMDIERVSAEVGLVIAALSGGVDAVGTLAAWLGDDFQGGDFQDKAWRHAVLVHATLVKLAFKCCESWTGIGFDDGGGEAELNEPNLALLLRDGAIAKKIAAVIEAPLHAVNAEKNGSAASPNGAAAAVEPTAQNAGDAAIPAPSDSPVQAASSAPKSSIGP